MPTRSRLAALVLVLVVPVGAATGCGGSSSDAAPPTGSSPSVPLGSSTASVSGSASRPTSSGGSEASEQQTDGSSATAVPTSPSGSSDTDRLLVAADVPGSTQQTPPGPVPGSARRMATVTITCAALPVAPPAYPAERAFVSVLDAGDGLVTSGLRVFGTESMAAAFMAGWQRRLAGCAGEEFVPVRWDAGDGYGADSFAADGSSAAIGQALDFYVLDGRRVAELHLILTDFTEHQLEDITARAAAKFL